MVVDVGGLDRLIVMVLPVYLPFVVIVGVKGGWQTVHGAWAIVFGGQRTPAGLQKLSDVSEQTRRFRRK